MNKDYLTQETLLNLELMIRVLRLNIFRQVHSHLANFDSGYEAIWYENRRKNSYLFVFANVGNKNSCFKISIYFRYKIKIDDQKSPIFFLHYFTFRASAFLNLFLRRK